MSVGLLTVEDTRFTAAEAQNSLASWRLLGFV